MEIKSTMIKNRSTHGTNHSTAGSNESISHHGDQEEHFTRAKVAGQYAGSVGKAKVEWKYDHIGEKGAPKGIPGGNGVPEGSFIPHKARNEPRFEHPNKKYDPACVKC